MFRFEKLEVWTASIKYGRQIYQVTNSLPKSEVFGLISQLNRAALSISSNIAEGSGSATNKDFCNFLDIAIKSTLETVSQLFFAQELGYIDEVNRKTLYEEADLLVRRIHGLKHYLKKEGSKYD